MLHGFDGVMVVEKRLRLLAAPTVLYLLNDEPQLNDVNALLNCAVVANDVTLLLRGTY
jgi:hypothetical protein